jgi:hypothetical protein
MIEYFSSSIVKNLSLEPHRRIIDLLEQALCLFGKA